MSNGDRRGPPGTFSLLRPAGEGKPQIVVGYGPGVVALGFGGHLFNMSPEDADMLAQALAEHARRARRAREEDRGRP